MAQCLLLPISHIYFRNHRLEACFPSWRITFCVNLQLLVINANCGYIFRMWAKLTFTQGTSQIRLGLNPRINLFILLSLFNFLFFYISWNIINILQESLLKLWLSWMYFKCVNYLQYLLGNFELNRASSAVMNWEVRKT